MITEKIPIQSENPLANISVQMAVLMLCTIYDEPVRVKNIRWILGQELNSEELGDLKSDLLLDTQNDDLYLSFITSNHKLKFIELLKQTFPEKSIKQIYQILVFNSELYM